ncbi:hypothetical protein [Methylobacterium sp. GC_Met_2]|uniref:hypothetical protein n=1 Tax=Methylobacterium sp. GC_Met_2 TaxID=2937376 RepID=UPI00226B9565|nr:hypothetical protein [Methylobacterium sp. GC_Met_2]
MSDQHPAFKTVYDMEEGVADIERYGDLLMDLGTGDHDLTRGGVYVIGKQLKILGQAVDTKWRLVFDQLKVPL